MLYDVLDVLYAESPSSCFGKADFDADRSGKTNAGCEAFSCNNAAPRATVDVCTFRDSSVVFVLIGTLEAALVLAVCRDNLAYKALLV
jgi:hypothetical protein